MTTIALMTPQELEALKDYGREQARRFGIPPDGYVSLIAAESSWDPSAVGSSGELGLAQFMPATAQDMGVTDRSDPQQSLEGGARYLAYLRDYVTEYAPELQGAQVWSAVLACYNWGLGNWGNAYDDLGDDWIARAPQITVSYISRLLPSFATNEPDTKKGLNIGILLAVLAGAFLLS